MSPSTITVYGKEVESFESPTSLNGASTRKKKETKEKVKKDWKLVERDDRRRKKKKKKRTLSKERRNRKEAISGLRGKTKTI